MNSTAKSNRILLFIVFSAIIVDVESQSYESHKLSDPQRKIILNEHNKFRSKLAFGKIKDKNGIYMPTAKNMLEVTWSEKLEKYGYDLALPDEECVATEDVLGFNIFGYIAFGEENIENVVSDAIFAGLNNWTSELKYRYENEPKNKYTSYVIQQNASNFIQMAWGKTHKIGCGAMVDVLRPFISVIFFCSYQPRGNVENELIYELGEPCKDHSDCDIGKCLEESGLCRKTEESIFGRLFRYPV